MDRKPTSVTVLGIIGIVLSGMGILGGIGMLILNIVHFSFSTDPLTKALNADVVYTTVNRVSMIVGIPIAVLLLASSIGSLTLAKWARRGMLTYAWLAVVQLVFGVFFSAVYVLPKIHELMVPSGPVAVQEAMIGGVLGGGCATIFGAIFPVCVLIFFRRKNVVDAFDGIFPQEPTNFPVIMEGQEGAGENKIY